MNEEIISDYVKLKLEAIKDLCFDKKYPGHGNGRLHKVTQSIENDLKDYDNETQALILDRLVVEITDNELSIYHDSARDYFPVDITNDVLKWINFRLIKWELKRTENNNDSKVKKQSYQFSDYFHNLGDISINIPVLIELLKAEFPTGRRTEAAIMIFALEENNVFKCPDKIGLTRALSMEWDYFAEYEQESNKLYPAFNKAYKLLSDIRDSTNRNKPNYNGKTVAAINKVKQLVAKSCI